MSVLAGRAHAQPEPDRELADQAYDEARRLVQQNRWEEACVRFEDSLRHEVALGTELNLARCDEHIGKLASAWHLYTQASDAAARAGDGERRDFAQDHAAALEPRVPRLVIAPPRDPPPGLTVTTDGTRIDPAALGVALRVDPGTHEVTASAPGFVTAALSVTVGEARSETLALPALQRSPSPADRPRKPPADASAATAGPAIRPLEERSEPVAAPSSARRRAGMWVGAAGVAVVGVGLVFGARAISSVSDAKRVCGADLRCDPASYDEGNRAIHDARSNATISSVLVAAGGAAVVAGAIVFLSARSPSDRTAARLVPQAHDRGGGLAVVGGF
jgi:hypothetical protein